MRRRELPAEVRAALSELKAGLSRLYGERLKRVYLFGSYARGDFRQDSDVDVLIVLRGPVRPFQEITLYSKLVSDICLKYDVLISTVPVSEDSLAVPVEPLFENVRQEGVLL